MLYIVRSVGRLLLSTYHTIGKSKATGMGFPIHRMACRVLHFLFRTLHLFCLLLLVWGEEHVRKRVVRTHCRGAHRVMTFPHQQIILRGVGDLVMCLCCGEDGLQGWTTMCSRIPFGLVFLLLRPAARRTRPSARGRRGTLLHVECCGTRIVLHHTCRGLHIPVRRPWSTLLKKVCSLRIASMIVTGMFPPCREKITAIPRTTTARPLPLLCYTRADGILRETHVSTPFRFLCWWLHG